MQSEKFLTLVRHGQASFGDIGSDDHSRELTPQGMADSAAVGRWLAQEADRGRFPAPDKIVASSARRTRQTADQIVAGVEGLNLEDDSVDPDLYLAPPGTILRRLQGTGAEVAHLVLVVHNPGAHQLADRLARGRRELSFSEATFQVTAHAVDWWELVEPGHGRWITTLSPGDPEFSTD